MKPETVLVRNANVRSVAVVVFALFGAAVTAACSSTNNASTADAGAGADAPASLCSTDPRAQNFSAGMVQKGTGGVFGIKLNSVAPWPIIKGNNAWDVVVVDASGAPVSGATFSVKPFMPDHGHGTSILPDITPGQGAGEFAIAELNVFMPGIWTFTFDITAPSASGPSETDTVVYTFCVDD